MGEQHDRRGQPFLFHHPCGVSCVFNLVGELGTTEVTLSRVATVFSSVP